jgi:hypothetical protein
VSEVEHLYHELRPDIEALASALFPLSEEFIRNQGEFLPHGAVLGGEGKPRLIMALPDFEEPELSCTEVLPLLHEALRDEARKDDELRAVAVCEDVTITPEGEESTAAIKVLVEHRRGLYLALYLPHHPTPSGDRTFGSVFVIPAAPEVLPWGEGQAD